MNLSHYKTMDIVMLMSIINMKLRDDFNGDLNALCSFYELSRQDLENRLAMANFQFINNIGQFR
ncbi:DUF4250 domain-containing protein [Vibrio sp.]|nr:DUF4250 domain-containing protein [Vibrio sp.]